MEESGDEAKAVVPQGRGPGEDQRGAGPAVGGLALNVRWTSRRLASQTETG